MVRNDLTDGDQRAGRADRDLQLQRKWHSGRKSSMSEHNGISRATRDARSNPSTREVQCLLTAPRNGYAQLLPLFGHLGHGAIVPAVALLHGGVEWGRFFHRNTVDEVTVCFGSHDGVLNPGSVMVGGKMHGVDSFLRSTDDPQSFMPGDYAATSGRRRTARNNHIPVQRVQSEDVCLRNSPGIDFRRSPRRNSDDDEALEFFPTQWGTWAAARSLQRR